MALTDGALDVGGARAMRLISKQRLARKLGRRKEGGTSGAILASSRRGGVPGDDEPFVPGGVAIRDKRDARYTRLFSGEPPPPEAPSQRVARAVLVVHRDVSPRRRAERRLGQN